MFMLNNQPLGIDVPFVVDGVQYPSNWLRHATLEEKNAIGIIEVDDPQPYDDRFYWGVDNPKDFTQVKAMLKSQLSAAAYSLLAPTDYKLVRKVETGEDVDQTTLDKRTAIREAYAANMVLLEAATTTPELAAIQFTWPESDAP